jgi:hypothetical protein
MIRPSGRCTMRRILLCILYLVICISCNKSPVTGSYSVSGSVSFNGLPLPGITLALASDRVTAQTLESSADGTFLFNDIWNGEYAITPSKSGYIFSPPSINIRIDNGNITGQNFTAAIMWKKSYGLANNEKASAIAATSDGGYIVAGSVETTGKSWDAFLLRLDRFGDVMWQKNYGDADYDVFTSIVVTNDGYFIAVGGSQSLSAGNKDIWIVKACDNKEYSIPETGWTDLQARHGGAADEYAQAVIQSSDGNYVLAGVACGTQSNWASRGSLSGFYTAKIQSGDLSILWDNCYGSGAYWDKATALCEVSDGFIIAGSVETTFDNIDMWIIKIDAAGSSSWVWSQTEDFSADDEVRAVTVLGDGSIAVCGDTLASNGSPDMFVVRYNAAGAYQTHSVFGGTMDDGAYGIIPDGGGFILLGQRQNSSLGRGDNDYYAVRMTTACEISWQTGYDRGDATDDNGVGIARCLDGGIVYVGNSVTGGSKTDIWVVKCDEAGVVHIQ